MNSLAAALAQVKDIEAAVASGDLELANKAAQELKPFLIDRGVDELVELRRRIENLTLGVTVIRAQGAGEIKKLSNSRGAAAAYQLMQGET